MSDLKKRKKGTPYTEEEFEFVRRHWQEMTDKEIGARIGRSAGSARNMRRQLGLTHYNRQEWTEEEEQIVRAYYPDTDNDTLLEMLPGRSVHSLYRKAYGLGLKKSEEFIEQQLQELAGNLAESGKAHQFKKGHVPMNKGQKQEEYMSAEAIERTKATRFQSGHKPHNTKWDGAITIRYDHKNRGGKPYVWIRIAEGNWEMYSRYQYKRHIGPIPEGHLVTFKDGNTLNCDPDNLECISMAENARRNHNPEKAAEALREYIKKHGTAAERLTDAFVASMLAGHDPELKEYFLTERPDLIDLARANYQLKREIRNEHNNE